MIESSRATHTGNFDGEFTTNNEDRSAKNKKYVLLINYFFIFYRWKQ